MITGTFDGQGVRPDDYPEGLPPLVTIRADADPMVEYIPRGLAVEIGEEEARMLLRVVWQIGISRHYRDGRWWTYQSVDDLHAFFPCWSRATVGRRIKKLVDDGYLISTNKYNQRKNDSTLWYAVNLEKLSTLESISLGFFDPATKKKVKDESLTEIRSSPTEMVESPPEMTLPEDTSEGTSEDTHDLKREESEISEKSKFRSLLKTVDVPDSAIQEVIGSLSFEHANAALLLTAACANGNHTAYLTKTIRNWGKYPSEAVTGLKQARSVWICGDCETHNYRATICGGCRAEREDVGAWAIPRET